MLPHPQWRIFGCCLTFPTALAASVFQFFSSFSDAQLCVFHFPAWSLPFSVLILHIVLASGIFHLKVAFLSSFLSVSLSSRYPCLDLRQYSLRFWVLICMPQMASERILVCLLPYWQTGISISSSAANNWICYKPCYFSMHTLFALQLMHTIPLTAFRAYPLACWQQNVLVSSNSICI